MHPMQEKLLALSKVRDLSRLSYRELGRQLADSDDPSDRVHPQTVRYHFDALVKSGNLSETQRPIKRQPTGNATSFELISIPVVGRASCGPATEYAGGEIDGYLEVSPGVLNTRNYQELCALWAIGDSMNESTIMGKNIDSGDFVIVDRSRRTPRNGEYVAVTRNNLTNIKRIYFDYGEEIVVLKSESIKRFDPIYVKPEDDWDSLINGTVIQVIKNPKISTHV